MLSRLLFAGLLLLVACEQEPAPTPPDAPAAVYVAVYYWSERGLAPEFHALEGDDPERALFSLLARGPQSNDLETRLPMDAELEQAGEAGEGHLLIEPNDAFWEGGRRVVYDRVVQVVQTMGVLEEGRSITLLKGVGPGRITTPAGRRLTQPLTRDDVEDPLVRVGQPAAGSTVGTTIPLLIDVKGGGPTRVIVERDGRLLARASLREGQGQIELEEDEPSGPIEIAIAMPGGIEVQVPVRLSS